MSATAPRPSPAPAGVNCFDELNAATESGRIGLRRAKQSYDKKNRSDQEMDNIIRHQILGPRLSVGLDDLRDYIRGGEPANPQEQIDHAKDLAEGARRGVCAGEAKVERDHCGQEMDYVVDPSQVHSQKVVF